MFLLVYWKHLGDVDELNNLEWRHMRKGRQDRDKIIQSRANKLYIRSLNMQWSGERYLQWRALQSRGQSISASTAPAFLLLRDRLAKLLSFNLVGDLACWLSLRDVVLDLTSHGCEGCLDILALLSWSLEEADAVMVGHLLALLERDSSSVLQIGLVSDQDSRDVVLRVLLDFAHPGVHGVEWVTVSDVIDDNDAVGALIVARGDGLEALLASGIPDLQLADLLVDVDGSDFEVHADSGHEVLLELVILQSCEEFWLGESEAKESRVAMILTANLRSRQDFPTPELPIMRTLKR